MFFYLDRARANNSDNRGKTNGGDSSREFLQIPDESTLSRFVAARLDLPISQSLLDQNFKLSIIKRCWEDQLRLKRKIKRRYLLGSRVTKHIFILGEDFVSDCDLLMACIILKKQIEHIDGKKENIAVPSVAMKKIREKEQAGNSFRKNTLACLYGSYVRSSCA